MSTTPEADKSLKLPSRKEAVVFRFKTALLQLRRALLDSANREIKRHSKASKLHSGAIIARSVSALWTETEGQERFLVAGKIHNIRLAVKRLDGLEIEAGQIFSFWKQIGRAGRLRGFVKGRELREGCIVPNTGGGLCQLSNALYDAALQAGFEIVERHPHTQVIPGSLAEIGRDATVFWNYIDLRFRSSSAFRIEAKLVDDELIVHFRSVTTPVETPVAKNGSMLHQIARVQASAESPKSCATCETDCHRALEPSANVDFGITAFLLDEYSPEFDSYVASVRSHRDKLFVPLDGKRFGKANYAWTTSGFASVRQSLAVTARRSIRSRKLAAQGAARQRNLLTMYEELAERYARRLSYDALHVVVQQNLLPYLWKNGHLGGRTFDVLMSALPMKEIQKRLDGAAAAHPESTTLADFRVEPELLAAEEEALKSARRLITPHSEVASLFPRRSVRLDWEMPAVADRSSTELNSRKPVVVFPATTVGRKGCYDLREALRGIDVKLILLGPLIEGADFWEGFDTERGPADWLDRADLLVLPAFVEHRPRRLLQAVAKGVPVIATPACGVSHIDGVTRVEAGNATALRLALLRELKVATAQLFPYSRCSKK